MPDTSGTNGDNVIVGDAGADVISALGGHDIVIALDGGDTIDGGEGDDDLRGGNGQDTIRGGDGDDTITGGLGADWHFPDWLYGGAGDDTFIAPQGIVDGGEGNDTLHLDIVAGANMLFEADHVQWADLSTGFTHFVSYQSIENFIGSEGRDQFWLGPGDSPITVHGAGGDDYFHPAANGASPHSYYYGDAGNDFFETMSSFAGSSFYGGEGDDFFWVNENINDHFDGGDGYDILRLRLDLDVLQSNVIDLASGQITYIINYPGLIPGPATQMFANIEHFILLDLGGFFATTVLGTPNDDVIEALLVDYDVFGAGGDDVLLGEEEISGGETAHRLYGDEGDDYLDGGEGDDLLQGGPGDDVLVGGRQNDTLDGGGGVDTASYGGNGSVTVDLNISGPQDTVGAGVDTLIGIENLVGGGGNDTLLGDAGANFLVGGAGDDLLNGRGGEDTVSYAAAGAAITVSLALTSPQNTGGAGIDTLLGVEILIGSAFADTLTGDGGANALRGGGGGDSVTGGAGDDVLYGEAGGDTLLGEGGLDMLYGGDGDDRLVGGAGNNVIDGGAGHDTLDYRGAAVGVMINLVAGLGNNGFGGEDTIVGVENLIGSAAADTLIGDPGDNELEGGLGDDTLIGGGGVDIASYANSGAGVSVALAQGLVQTGAAGIDSFSGIRGLRGSAFNDALVGDSGDNIIEGGAGDDILAGGAGVDTVSFAHSNRGVKLDLRVTTSQNTVGQGSDTIQGFENVLGSIYPDVIHGDAGANLIIGNGGASDGVINGGDNIFGGGGDDIIVAGSGGGVFDGEAGDDIIYGGDDSDNIIGMEGVDILYGGGGSDIYHIDDPADQIIEYATNEIDHIDYVHVEGDFDYTAPDNVEVIYVHGVNATGYGNALDNQIQTGDSDNRLFGYAGDDRLFGDYGNDFLVGGEGADLLIGGEGIDTASYADSAAGVRVFLTLGIGFYGDAEGDTLSGVENLTGSAFDDQLVGDDKSNVLIGLDGADTLDGGAGADQMNGGLGDDTYYLDAADMVIELPGEGTDTVIASISYALVANVENLTLAGAAAINGFGNALANAITGNGAANQLNGFDGADTLDGAAGADSMFGGNGDDVYVVDNAGDLTTEVSALGGTDTVFSSVSRNLTANIENLTLTGAAVTAAGNTLDNILIGNSAANILYGFVGNDSLDGGAGADTLFGAAGEDTYYVDDVGDITVEGIAGPAGGVDTVITSISRNMNANFENMTLVGAATIAYGNVLNNVLIGNGLANSLYGFDGNDTLDGGAGADQMFGANGDDTYIVDDAGDVTSEVSALGGVDTVRSSVTRNLTANLENLTLTGNAAITGAGNALNNVITGNSAANTLFGLDGADTLDGGLGADTLQGGPGADTYVFSSAIGGGNVDTVVNFNVADDTIQLNNSVFTGMAAGALDAAAFVTGSAAADADDRVIYDSATGALYFDADGAGGAAQIQFASLAAGLALTSADFIVGGP